MTKKMIVEVEGESAEVEVPDDAQVNELVAALIDEFFLEEDPGAPYFLELSQQRLDGHQTWETIEVEPGQILRLVKGPPLAEDAGLFEDPAYETVFEILRKVRIINHGLFDFAVTSPAERIFCLSLNYRTMAPFWVGDEQHLTVMLANKVEMQVPADYPASPPRLKWLTPIFHPHIMEGRYLDWLFRSWRGDSKLEESLARLVNMMQLRAGSYDLRTTQNREAAAWVRRNRKQLPIGDKPLQIELTCGQCKHEIAELGQLTYCRDCNARYHKTCWEEAGGCNNPSCPGRVEPKRSDKPRITRRKGSLSEE